MGCEEEVAVPPDMMVLPSTRPLPVLLGWQGAAPLEGEINYLLLKQVVCIVPRFGTRTGFMSSFFLTPKKEVSRVAPINIKPETPQQVYSSQEFSCTILNNNPCRQSGPKGPVSTRLYQAGELQISQKFS